MISLTHKKGDTGTYVNSVIDMKTKFEVAKDTDIKAKIIPVNLFNDKGEIEYNNAYI